MRLLAPALLLAASACAPAGGIDPYGNGFIAAEGEEEEGNIASADYEPGEEAQGRHAGPTRVQRQRLAGQPDRSHFLHVGVSRRGGTG